MSAAGAEVEPMPVNVAISVTDIVGSMDDTDGVRTSESAAVPPGLRLSETALDVEPSNVLSPL